MTHKSFLSVVAVALGFAGSTAVAQNVRPSVEVALRDMAAPELAVRMGAFDVLSSQRAALGMSAGAAALVAGLERENELIESILRASNGKETVGDRYGEGYGEYYAELLGACATHCNRSEARTIRALARAAYDPRSDFALDLAKRHGPELVPLMIEDLDSMHSRRKNDALRMLGEIVALNPALPAAARRAARDAIVRGAQDPTSFLVRRAGVQALGRAGTAADIALLERIAERDSGIAMVNGRTTYPVRDAARQAIVTLRK